MAAIGFDVYGTLVDPLAMSGALKQHADDRAGEMATLWRAKQLEYSFRRTLMGAYENFDVCTRDALHFAARTMRVELCEADEEVLLDEYLNLAAYPDVIPGIRELRARGHHLVAFSNGVAATLHELLGRAGVLEHLDGIVSVDEVGAFKPSTAVYHHLAERLGRPLDEIWLVSSNYWDVIGAIHAGLHAVWLRRDPNAIPDPWGPDPDFIIRSLDELANLMS